MQQCINTQGSYNCSCDQYFKTDPADCVWVSVVILVHFWPGYKREHEVCMQPAENVRPFWLSSIDLVACQRSCKKKRKKNRQQQQQQKQRKALTSLQINFKGKK